MWNSASCSRRTARSCCGTKPIVYNLCRQIISCDGGPELFIYNDNVTLNNGSLLATHAPSSRHSSQACIIKVSGTGMILERITIRGAYKGVVVNRGGQLTPQCATARCMGAVQGKKKKKKGVAVCNTSDKWFTPSPSAVRSLSN